jgi:hypothetical protein
LQGNPYTGGLFSKTTDKQREYPIFDGGISVINDTFVIQYKNSAELIKISDKGCKDYEKVTRMHLWDWN